MGHTDILTMCLTTQQFYFLSAAAVGSRDSVRFLRLDGGSVFFDSVLSGQDVGESARGAARWAAPLH